MINKNCIITIISILIISVILSGCNESNNNFKSDEDRIIGTWIISEDYEGAPITITYIFNTDKTYQVIGKSEEITESYNGSWQISDDKLIVTIEGRTQTGDYQFSNDDKTLTITDDSSNTTNILHKQ